MHLMFDYMAAVALRSALADPTATRSVKRRERAPRRLPGPTGQASREERR